MAERKPLDNKTSYISEEHKQLLARLIANNEPKTDEDLIVLVAHAVLLRSCFKVVYAERYDDNNSPSLGLEGEALPGSWNSQDDPGCYELSYLNTEKQNLFDFRGLIIEDKLCFTLLERGRNYATATQVQVIVNDHVKRKDKPINSEWLIDAGFLWKLIENGLFGKHKDLVEKRDEELHTKMLELERPRQNIGRKSDLLLQDNVSIQQPHVFQETSRFERPSPFAYGDADRLPGHPGLGGMMMDPLRSGGMGLRPPGYPGIPRGSVPPGARFDPFGPLTDFDYGAGDRRPTRSFDPNPDHLRRPGFYEDMFM